MLGKNKTHEGTFILIFIEYIFYLHCQSSNTASLTASCLDPSCNPAAIWSESFSCNVQLRVKSQEILQSSP